MYLANRPRQQSKCTQQQLNKLWEEHLLFKQDAEPKLEKVLVLTRLGDTLVKDTLANKQQMCVSHEIFLSYAFNL